ncbi:hypothetical protein BGZ47_000328 [Haplosporangium gracile]|nr:hypothetical protein BGZ47_000328 [Haplosporangium gracile]
MRFPLAAALTTFLVSTVFGHMEQLESGLIDYFWLKGSDGSTEFNSYNPLPENGLFSVPKGASIGELAVFYDHDAKDDHLDPVQARFEFSCVIKFCRNSA